MRNRTLGRCYANVVRWNRNQTPATLQHLCNATTTSNSCNGESLAATGNTQVTDTSDASKKPKHSTSCTAITSQSNISQASTAPRTSKSTPKHQKPKDSPASSTQETPSKHHRNSSQKLRHPFACNVPDIFLFEHDTDEPSQQHTPQERQRQRRKLSKLRGQLSWEAISMGKVLEVFYPRKYDPAMSHFSTELHAATQEGDEPAKAAAAAGLLREAQQHLLQHQWQQQGSPEQWQEVSQQLDAAASRRWQQQGPSWLQRPQQQQQQGWGHSALEDDHGDVSDADAEGFSDDDDDVYDDEEVEEEEEWEAPSSARKIVGSVVYGYWSRCPFG